MIRSLLYLNLGGCNIIVIMSPNFKLEREKSKEDFNGMTGKVTML